MWNYLRSLVAAEQPAAPFPSLVAVKGIRFPSDGSKPYIVSLTTTIYGVADESDSPWGHVPDLRGFWKTPRAWKWRDFETFRLENQPPINCDGLYILFYSFDMESLPANNNVHIATSLGEQRTFAGDAFAVKLKGNEIGSDLGEDGWAVWDDVPLNILSLPVMKA